MKTNFTISTNEYFNNLIITLFPQYIRKENFDYFVKYNLINIFPTYKYIISSKGIVSIQNDNNITIASSYIF